MTEQKRDGGPAFPAFERHAQWPTSKYEYSPVGGMSLRDYFAGQVISQCHITVAREEPEPDAMVIAVYAERYARTAYVIADAMLKARKAVPHD